MPCRRSIAALLLLILPLAALAAEEKPPEKLLPADAVTHHAITAGGQELRYTATAGSLPLRNEKGEFRAEIFYTAFVLDGVADPARRPITYAFNGGPGAASAYLDIGALGPRAIDFGPEGALPPAASRVADNPDTWLPFTDLVFIDPVGTGYSRATSDEAAKHYWGVREDLEALGRIIQLHATKADRLTSPIYLVGESYGGFRAARLAHQLATDFGINPAGVLLISPAIDFALMTDNPIEVLPWALRLPTYAAVTLTAEGPVKPEALAAAERYALGPYLTALAAGPTDAAAAEPVYREVARLTGIDESTVARWRGRVPLGAYLKEAHRAESRVVSRYDGTVTVPDPRPWSDHVRDDPILAAATAPFTRAFTAYARDELGFKTDLPFELLNGEVGHNWNWHEGGNGWDTAVGASEELAAAMTLEPKLRLLIAHGITDLQTPYMMSRYVADHLPGVERSRIALKLYDGGHMMYIRGSSRHLLRDDAAAFYAEQ
jgi:carboxypeptidase C (cathepsin A)